MTENVDLRAFEHGVIYRPGGIGWQIFPEDSLFVGNTGTAAARTIIRSVLRFRLPVHEPDTTIVQGILHLHLVKNEPATAPKVIRVREAPHADWSPWSLEEEEREPVLAEYGLAPLAAPGVEIDLTQYVSAPRQDAAGRGLLLSSLAEVPALLCFSGLNGGETAPVLRIVTAHLAPGHEKTSLEVPADAERDSGLFPAARLLITNNGPGLAWITPLYRFGNNPPVDPAGLPLGVLDPGGHMLIDPVPYADGLLVRVQTALLAATVMIGPG